AVLRLEGEGRDRALLVLQEDLDPALGGLELLIAGPGEPDSLLEQLEGVLERHVAVLELPDDLLEPRERGLEPGFLHRHVQPPGGSALRTSQRRLPFESRTRTSLPSRSGFASVRTCAVAAS